MILAAIDHSSTDRDCFCIEPGRFLFRLRSAKGNLAEVILHYQDKYLPLSICDTRAQQPMKLLCSDAVTDYWETELEFHVVCLRYWFELVDREGNRSFYSDFRFAEEPFTDIDDMFDCPQTLREEERFQTPVWAANQVIYQIFPSRFATDQQVAEEEWYKTPIGFRDHLHGNLRGIIDHLDHLQELGVDILYMTPVFRSKSCHKYDTIDYYQIDPEFGTREDLKELTDRAHAMGMRVILDGVFNHTSPEFFAFQDIREKETASSYLDWYYIEGFPLRSKWGEKPNFKTFSYFGGMPKLNLRNPETAEYVRNVALYWLRECGIDGWRLDVGDEIGHTFWREFRETIKAEFPEALIIGEVWHYAEDFLRGEEWDTVMNYPFRQNILRLLVKEEISVSQFAQRLNFLKGRLHPKVHPLLWNLIGSHDTPRIRTLCGSRERMKLIAALQLLLPGMPMIYYGDEYGMEGGQDPDCRRGMVWDPKRQDGQLYDWYCRLIRIRKELPELLDRSAEWIGNDENGLLIYRAGEHRVLFCCKEETVFLPAYQGQRNLLSGEVFDGKLSGFGVVIF